jgi:hypothetical protein
MTTTSDKNLPTAPPNGRTYFGVKNLEKFQHYKDRNPPWIKLYNELLDDYEFACLQDASKLHLILIWLLASRSDNRIPFNEKWVAAKINASEPVDLDALVSSGFLFVYDSASNVLAPCKQSARPETETETETETEGEKETDSRGAAPASRDPGPSRDGIPLGKPADPKGKRPNAPRKQPTGPHAELIRHHGQLWSSRFGTSYDFKDGRDGAAVGRIIRACGGDVDRAKKLVSAFVADTDPFIAKSGYTLSFLVSQTNRYLSGAHLGVTPRTGSPLRGEEDSGPPPPGFEAQFTPEQLRAIDEVNAAARRNGEKVSA